MKILYKFASRSRPEKFFAAVDNIIKMALHDNYVIVGTCDYDDNTMFNETVRERAKQYPMLRIHYGESKSKVDAINRDMEFYNDWDVLINMSDDMEFIRHGFDKEIISDFNMRRSLDILIHYPDQAAGSALITMAIMGKYYYDRFKYIYHPDYKSLFCDNDQQEQAKLISRYVYIKKRLFNHNHPAWGHGQADALMKHTESFHNEDKATFERRKALNFPI